MKKILKPWSEEEKEFLKANYGKIRAKDIGLKLNRNARSVICKANYMGLSSDLHQDTSVFVMESIKKKFVIIKKDKNLVYVQCPYCPAQFWAKPSVLANGHKKSCGCSSLGKRKGGKYISSTLFSHIQRGAEYRNLEFNVSFDYLDSLLEQQNFMCVLSGEKLTSSYQTKLRTVNLSLDRIDSSKGYIEGNVQWVSKTVNLSKQSLTNKDYIELCKKVVNHNK